MNWLRLAPLMALLWLVQVAFGHRSGGEPAARDSSAGGAPVRDEQVQELRRCRADLAVSQHARQTLETKLGAVVGNGIETLLRQGKAAAAQRDQIEALVERRQHAWAGRMDASTVHRLLSPQGPAGTKSETAASVKKTPAAAERAAKMLEASDKALKATTTVLDPTGRETLAALHESLAAEKATVAELRQKVAAKSDCSRPTGATNSTGKA